MESLAALLATVERWVEAHNTKVLVRLMLELDVVRAIETQDQIVEEKMKCALVALVETRSHGVIRA